MSRLLQLTDNYCDRAMVQWLVLLWSRRVFFTHFYCIEYYDPPPVIVDWSVSIHDSCETSRAQSSVIEPPSVHDGVRARDSVVN